MLAMAGILLFALLDTVSADSSTVALPRFPSISPDGSEIVFSWGGDLWRASADGGRAIRLTRHRLDDLHSSWSPDGEWITFTSMRDGYMNLWRIHRDGTHLTQLTHGDRYTRNPAYGSDRNGEPVITFSGSLEADVYRDERPYVLSPEGGEYTRLHDAFGSEPQLSPDGRYAAFTRGGYYHGWSRRHYRGPDARDIWLYDLDKKRFEALTSREGDDGKPQWVNDHSLVFMSDREHRTVNLYRLDLQAEPRDIRPITEFVDRDIQHFDISQDGHRAVLHVWDTLYTLDLDDPHAKPRPVLLRAGDDGHDRYQLRKIDRDVTEAALSPDGKVMAYIAYGRVYVRHMDEHSQTRAVTPDTHARHQGLSWSPDGLRLYFSNDSDGTVSIYSAHVALTRAEIRKDYAPVPVRGLPRHQGYPLRTASLTQTASSSAKPDAGHAPDPGLEPDDPEDPFAPVDPGIPADPLDPSEPADPPPLQEPTQELPDIPESIPENELDPERQDDLPAALDPARWHDAVQFSVQPVVQTEHNDRNASPSPDGQFLAFRRGRGDLMVMDLRTGQTRMLVEGWDNNIHWRWSPDSRYIAYAQNDLNFSANIYIVPANGARPPVNITRHPRNDLNPRWSADSRKLTFISNRAGDTYDLYSVYLDPELELYTARELSTYYRDARSKAGARRALPVRPTNASARLQTTRDALDLDNAWRRIKRVSALPTHQTANEMTPGGDRYVFNSGGQGLMVMNWDGSGKKRIGSLVDVQHMSIAGDRVVYVNRGRVGVVSLSGGKHLYPDISGSIRIDRAEQSLQKFREAARMIDENFYRPDMKGLDWPTVVKDYETLIRRARTSSEFSDIANRLMGELAASHLGVSNPGPGSTLRQPSGRLGIDYEPMALGNGKLGLRITDVVPNSPADRNPMPLQPGDIVTEIDLQPLEQGETLLGRLRGRVDQELILTFERLSGGSRHTYRKLAIPVDFAELSRLKYDAFLEQSRKAVDTLSNGRLGYIHIQAMNQTSLEGFQGDLYAAAAGKEGLIIDVRNNGGGNTTDRILTSIMAPEHAYTVPAGADPSGFRHYPQDRLDAPRYTLPINMLANEKSYSNAEILAHAFSTLGRGTLVGQQTYGGVISTGNYTLIDGATVRRPFRGWYLPDGTDMEQHGAMPDLLVHQTPEDEVANLDRQLESAVIDLLQRLGQQNASR